MGTRADFWIEGENTMEWIGSVAYDGHPENFVEEFKITDVEEFRERIRSFIAGVDHGTLPERGYPFGWSETLRSDHVYVFREKYNKVYEALPSHWDTSYTRGIYIDPLTEPYTIFPSLESIMNDAGGMRSGRMIIGVTIDGRIGIDERDTSVDRMFPPAKFSKCKFCDAWKSLGDGSCKCLERYGRKLTVEEMGEFDDTGLVKDAKEKGYAWGDDGVCRYRAFYIDGSLTIFEEKISCKQKYVSRL